MKRKVLLLLLFGVLGLANFANAQFTAENESYTYPRRIVVEEGTGTWCTWCPRGTVGMASMKETYPDTFIGIAVHSGDEMALSSSGYITGLYFPNGFPASRMNRIGAGTSNSLLDPGFGTLNAAYLSIISIPCQVGVEVEGYINSGNGNKLEILSTVRFGFNASDAKYQIAYVLIENDVTGYSQVNGYSGGSTVMGGWENLPNPAEVPFNEVARYIYDGFTGVGNSIPTTIKANEPIEHSYSVTLPSNIQDTDQLELVALVIDLGSGQIINAAKTHLPVTDYIATGSVTIDETELFLQNKKSHQLTATVLPRLSFNQNVTWSSSDPDIVYVTDDGFIVARDYGEATISVTTEEGNHTAECKVTVYGPVESVDLNEKALEIKIGETFQLIATVSPEYVLSKEVAWSVSTPGIISQSAEDPGLIEGVARGTTTITVTTAEGGYTASCDVRVYDPVAINKVDGGEEVIGYAYAKDGSLFININAAGDVAIDLFDINGRKIMAHNASLNGKGLIILPVDSSGIYLLRVMSSTGTFVKKVIL